MIVNSWNNEVDIGRHESILGYIETYTVFSLFRYDSYHTINKLFIWDCFRNKKISIIAAVDMYADWNTRTLTCLCTAYPHTSNAHSNFSFVYLCACMFGILVHINDSSILSTVSALTFGSDYWEFNHYMRYQMSKLRM